MQAKLDKVTTTLGWSFIGTLAGIGAVGFIDSREKIGPIRLVSKREFMKVGVFLGTVCLFTTYGYGSARQAFVRQKMQIV